MVGMFNSSGATLRSQIYPEQQQSSIMSVFRILLNILVVVGTKVSDNANDLESVKEVFLIIAAVHLVAAGLQLMLSTSTTDGGTGGGEEGVVEKAEKGGKAA